jgi:diphthamide synthase (EF-2-diphthine--ammonia ligase)
MSMAKPKALVAWSSGKDSAWALHEARQSGDYDIVGALTTVTDTFQRVSVHGVREELLLAQLDAADLAATIVRITHVIFGDLFLEDIRAYREKNLHAIGMTPVFPLWLRRTDALARKMIADGVEAHLATIDLTKLPLELVGRRFDSDLLDELPEGTDPCGENGEFHSFVSAGPMLKRRIPVSVGETVERNGFAYADLVMA